MNTLFKRGQNLLDVKRLFFNKKLFDETDTRKKKKKKKKNICIKVWKDILITFVARFLVLCQF